MEENLGHIKNCIQEMHGYQLDPDITEVKLNDLQDRSRRNSLRVKSIKERPNET